MDDEEYLARFGRRKPSQRERRIAARIVVRCDRALGRRTPEWIRKLATEK